MEIIKVFSTRTNQDYDLIIIKEKICDKYRIVNLTRQWLCPCVFDSYEDALKDIYRYEAEHKNIVDPSRYHMEVMLDEN